MAVPEDKLFWENIRQAVQQVENDNQRTITFTLASKRAVISYHELVGVVIIIDEVPISHKENLIVP